MTRMKISLQGVESHSRITARVAAGKVSGVLTPWDEEQLERAPGNEGCVSNRVANKKSWSDVVLAFYTRKTH